MKRYIDCPHCNNSIGVTEALYQRSLSEALTLTCPHCEKNFVPPGSVGNHNKRNAFWRVAITLAILYIGSYNFFIEYANYEKGKNAFKQTVFQLDRETLNVGKEKVLEIMKEKTPWFTEFAPWEYGSYSVGMDKEDRKFNYWRNTLIFPAVGVAAMGLIFWMFTGIAPID